MSTRERALLRDELLQTHQRGAAVLAELGALGPPTVPLSKARQLESIVRHHPGEHRVGDLAARVGVTLHSARTHLARLAQSGKIRRVRHGVYAALPTGETTRSAKGARAAKRAPSAPPSLLTKLHALLAGATRAMTTDEIFARAKVPRAQRPRALGVLGRLVAEGRVRRIRQGIYAPLEGTAIPALPPTLGDQLRAAVDASGRAMTADEIIVAADVPPRLHSSVNSTLTKLVNKGRLRRVQRGVYAPLDVAEPALPPPPPRSLFRQLCDVLDGRGHAMTVAEILNAADVPSEQRVSARAMLSAIVQRGLARRVATGVYAPLQEALAPAPPSMAASLVALLAKHPEGLDAATMGARVKAGDAELDEALRDLLRAKRVRRVRRGVYVATT